MWHVRGLLLSQYLAATVFSELQFHLSVGIIGVIYFAMLLAFAGSTIPYGILTDKLVRYYYMMQQQQLEKGLQVRLQQMHTYQHVEERDARLYEPHQVTLEVACCCSLLSLTSLYHAFSLYQSSNSTLHHAHHPQRIPRCLIIAGLVVSCIGFVFIGPPEFITTP